jgi:predicted nucleotidyltransferase
MRDGLPVLFNYNKKTEPKSQFIEMIPDYSTYIEGWKKRQRREIAEIEKRRRQALQVAEQASKILRQHGAKRIIVFGSVLDEAFGLKSDIDLAVDMPTDKWWEWYLKLGEELDFPIDLVHLRRIAPGFRESILEFGEVLYDKKKRHRRITRTDRKRVS